AIMGDIWQQILENFLISGNNCSGYTEDAQGIQNYVMERLKSVDSQFAKAFDGLSLGGSYLDRVKLGTPDEFDLHMKLKFPFPIYPKADRDGFVYLYAPHGNSCNIVSSDGYIRTAALQDWLRDAFRKIFTSNLSLKCPSGRSYEVSYTLAGYACAHSLKATCGNRIIEFDLVPAFSFARSEWPLSNPPVPSNIAAQWPWYAVPQKKKHSNDDRTYLAISPMWEREMMKDKQNLKNVLRLMKGLRDAHKRDLPHLSSYMLKTVILNRFDYISWNSNLGSLFVEMWGRLVEYLRNRRLPYYLDNGHNVFDRMNDQELSKCLATATDLLYKLRNYQNNPGHLMNLFDLN
ncbi:hypothetical protein KR074_010678, partial [Drosophila pseudoananassae]